MFVVRMVKVTQCVYVCGESYFHPPTTPTRLLSSLYLSLVLTYFLLLLVYSTIRDLGQAVKLPDQNDSVYLLPSLCYSGYPFTGFPFIVQHFSSSRSSSNVLPVMPSMEAFEDFRSISLLITGNNIKYACTYYT